MAPPGVPVGRSERSIGYIISGWRVPSGPHGAELCLLALTCLASRDHRLHICPTWRCRHPGPIRRRSHPHLPLGGLGSAHLLDPPLITRMRMRMARTHGASSSTVAAGSRLAPSARARTLAADPRDSTVCTPRGLLCHDRQLGFAFDGLVAIRPDCATSRCTPLHHPPQFSERPWAGPEPTTTVPGPGCAMRAVDSLHSGPQPRLGSWSVCRCARILAPRRSASRGV